MTETNVNAETSTEGSSLGFTRYDVLSLLWKNAEWLNDKIHKQRIKFTPVMAKRVWMVQVQSGVCKVILSGLKDETIEQRLKTLEDLVRTGVVIPGPSKEQIKREKMVKSGKRWQ